MYRRKRLKGVVKWQKIGEDEVAAKIAECSALQSEAGCAGAGDDCPPRVHAFSLPFERRSRGSAHASATSGVLGSRNSRSDFGDEVKHDELDE